ncbi:MAG TPA: efflux RND transporter periplasmic adaptor subunit [Candidatus Binatia bacterium]|nr:efflux RND transporter periplasmic adaptor subunit [Candidatus Binatia bacterium]
MRTGLNFLIGLALLVVGAVAGAVWVERRVANEAGRTAASGVAGSTPGTAGSGETGQAGGTPAEEILEVVLTPEALQRAGVKTAEVRRQTAGPVLTVPGTVTSNAYRETKVNALVGGVVRQVGVELGSVVERGQPLAVIFSAELAEAQMKYLSARAMLQAEAQKLERTRRLAELGAASRQELEEVAAGHAARETEAAAARQRLLLLGLPAERVAQLEHASQVVSEVTVAAPASGTVVARMVNPGQVVGAGQELFVVTELGSVWIIGDLYEKDFPAVRVGTPASIIVPSFPDLSLRGRVAYIDPRLDPATRTAKVRVEVPNRDGHLRFGMFVTVGFQTGGGQPRTMVVPSSAVQVIGERAVVYVAVEGEEGKFAERPVKLGQQIGELIEVLEGLKPGERVVTEGSFFLRAEAARARSGG